MDQVGDTQPLADLFLGKVDHYVFMSSAGVYLKSDMVSWSYAARAAAANVQHSIVQEVQHQV
jgi:hypothetical protein